MTDIYLVRHGETEWNTLGRYQGHLNSPLTELGQRQAQAAGRYLRRHRLEVFYSSDLGRAEETATLLRRAAGADASPLHLDPRLRERHMGVIQGHTRDDAAEHLTEAMAAYHHPNPDVRIEDGETLRELYDRAVEVLHEIAARHQGQRVGVVTHGGWLVTVFRHLVGLELSAPRRVDAFNASIHHVVARDGALRLRTWGMVDHLSELPDHTFNAIGQR